MGLKLTLPRHRLRPVRDALFIGGLVLALGCGRSTLVGQETWSLSGEPTVVIGVAQGPGPSTFHDIRGVVRAGPDVIVVADGGSKQIRVFSSAGEFLRSFGRDGDGPREFRAIAWLELCGGTAIVAYDSRRHRVTKWGTDGTLLSEFGVESPAGDLPPYQVRCGTSGDFVVMAWPRVVGVSRDRGPYRPSVSIGVADQRGRLNRLVGEFPGPERLRTERNDRPHPFGKLTHVGIGPAGVYVGTADSFAVQLVDSIGRVRTFGTGRPVLPLTPQLREDWIDTYLARAPEGQRPSLKRSLLDSEWGSSAESVGEIAM